MSSAGNNLGFDVDYPAKLQRVISVSSITKDKQKMTTSSIGKIDFVTIGQDVEVANIEGSKSISSGSSLATAKISSMVIREMLNDLSFKKNPQKIYQILSNSAEDLGKFGDDEIYGKGYINLNN